jgi:hypothetical protein
VKFEEAFGFFEQDPGAVERAVADVFPEDADRQEHAGQVDANTPVVKYSYEGGSANTVRRKEMTYPELEVGTGSRVRDYDYGSGTEENNILSRVQALKINGESSDAVKYAYMGLARYVKVDYQKQSGEQE